MHLLLQSPDINRRAGAGASLAQLERTKLVAPDTERKRRLPRKVAALLALAAVGLALFVVAISAGGGGSHAASKAAVPAQPPAAHASNSKSAAPGAAPAPAAQPESAIPQNNGGDGDPDNNGGPDDGDGNI
jgi:hypothetical protein